MISSHCKHYIPSLCGCNSNSRCDKDCTKYELDRTCEHECDLYNTSDEYLCNSCKKIYYNNIKFKDEK